MAFRSQEDDDMMGSEWRVVSGRLDGFIPHCGRRRSIYRGKRDNLSE
jgi:hypothetical protein